MANHNLNSKIDKNAIETPIVSFTENAYRELKLIIDNDFTLAGKYFRIVISGKGCDGFNYSVGFTDINEDDFSIKIKSNNDAEDLCIIIDPFTAFYLKEATVDFHLDPILNLEGFLVENHLQKEYQGKFFNKDQSKLPPMVNLGV